MCSETCHTIPLCLWIEAHWILLQSNNLQYCCQYLLIPNTLRALKTHRLTQYFINYTHNLFSAYVSTLVCLLYTICRWLGATVMQGKAAKLALWKSMFANWVASRLSQLLVDLARMVAKSCAWPLDALCCLQRVLSSPWEARALVPTLWSGSISCELSWSRRTRGAGMPVVQIRRILLINCLQVNC